MQDSLFHIQDVEIRAERMFRKENAGIKQTVVDSAILSDKANVSLSDLLSKNTGVFIKNHGRGALATASFRGTAPSHTRVNWNGISINSPMAGMVDFSLIPVYIVDNLDLKHGAASIGENGGGLGGSINLGNSARWNGGTGVRYIQGVGSYSTFNEFLQAGFGGSRFRAETRLYHNYSKNDFTFVNRGVGIPDPATGKVIHPVDTNDNASYLNYGLLQEFYFRPRSKHVISFKYWGQNASRTIPRPTTYEGPDHANLNNQLDTDHRLAADWIYYGERDRVMLRSGYADKNLVYTRENRVSGLGRVPVIYSVSRQRSLVNTISYARELRHDISLEGKLDVNHHGVVSRDTVSREGYKGSRDEVSILATVQKGFADRLNVKVMFRQEWVDGERAPLVPFLGLDYRLIKGRELILKANIARNYQLPTLNDLNWQPGGNPDLRPEQGFSTEGGMEYRQEFAGHLVRTGVTVFRSDIKDWIIWIPSLKGYWEPKNIEEVVASGVECDLQVRGQAGKFHYRVSGNYALTRSVSFGESRTWGDASFGKQLPYIPLHSGNLMVHASWRGLFVTYQYNAYSERFTTSSNDLSLRHRMVPYFMNDMTAGSAFRIKKTEISVELKVYNLLNESYQSILYRPMPGRNYHLVIKLKI